MGDKISDHERAEIAAFILRKGITYCSPGDALGAHMSWHITHFEDWLSRQGLSVVPMREPTFQSKVQKVVSGRQNGIDAILKYAA